ncbi:Cation transport regulator-like protein 1 [Trachymyrmex septentrionalis]|uniref:glutathione-specific gamma-glutamylcyclotransferase n=2 Tax=Trachymyrmex septentrionalis TaxID=34720 RepID=A0A195FUR8_9HYME|nr:PREDICTED: glutathione-specific gamma-glutamylcyclotransferase 1 isoform X2 [Trachymyrmex septentrionalis]XP_018355817.1 PREDICTED: glutathione-specific gamma-glutamylcyclotransferase 1 isoform X2 [Trachymyrmex septentrionalis]XP_018355818.1 PREDICTED: glutathione-specific gamma-glutamylcyclotransferase 1 isoform X2 [Trachymyrmex septentrionalis]KYN44032.1 Cation transport regulator-like protein 1 [Trachymyrmex septentrionalis]
MNRTEGNELWVFGYGSLCWHPGFAYTKSKTGYVKGFSRRFWQGNTTHRGTAEKPGRVVTLIEDKEAVVYGRAFQLQNNCNVDNFSYLENRECTLGGYDLTTIATFYSQHEDLQFPVIIYIATNKNKQWLGEASLQTVARQITECSGPSGHNVEYLLRLAEFMHRYLPEAHDEHLFTLEMLVRSRIKEENMCLVTLMGNNNFDIDLDEDAESAVSAEEVNERARENSFQFSARIPSKSLRCVKM